MKPLTTKQANAIWDVLETNGAVRPNDLQYRSNFVWNQTIEFVTEYRFMGTLGMGGKFWRNNGRWYVNCYREDETPEILAIIAKTNEALSKLKAVVYDDPDEGSDPGDEHVEPAQKVGR